MNGMIRNAQIMRLHNKMVTTISYRIGDLSEGVRGTDRSFALFAPRWTTKKIAPQAAQKDLLRERSLNKVFRT